MKRAPKQPTPETKQPGAASHPKHKIHAFWPPHAAGPAIIVAGQWAHQTWGTDLPAAVIVPMALVLSTLVLSSLTHRYAAPRNNVQQWHATITVLILGLSLSAVTLFGVGQFFVPNALGQSVVFVCLVLALSWNVRRFEVVRGHGGEQTAGPADTEWHGLKRPKSFKITEQTDARTTAKVTLADGQVAADVEKVLREMGSSAGTITGGQRVTKGAREGEVEITLLWSDPLTHAVSWKGPEYIGGSIGDPISLGINELGSQVFLRMAGDYRANPPIAPGHTKIVGMPRSGKGVAVVVIWTNLRSRIDVFPVINDASKGEQLLMLLRPSMPQRKAWIDKTAAGAKVQAAAVRRAITARATALGEAGMSSWTPRAFKEGFMWKGQRIHMPAIVFHIEEFAPIGSASPTLFTEIGEQGLSAGVFLIVSTQRASHDRMPTSLRSLIANGLCYGAFDDMDVSFALSGSTTDGGATPAEWGTKYPGRAMAEFNGQPDGMARIPFATHFASGPDEFEDYVKKVMAYLLPLAPDLDPCTIEAFGAPYQTYLTSDNATGGPVRTETKPGSDDTDNDEYDPTEPYTGQDDEEEDMDDPDDPNAAQYVRRPLPPDVNISGIDPSEQIPEWEGPEILHGGPPTPGRQLRVLSPSEKRQLFRDILQRLADEGRTDSLVSTRELNDLWREELGHPGANQSPTVARFIAAAAAEDATNGDDDVLIGCLERRRRAQYRLLIQPRAKAMNGHGV